MLVIFITSVIFLLGFSSGDHCPSLIYCTCSSDLTKITCTNRRLTNDLLLKLNNQLPNSTILLNLSSNSLTSIKSLSNLNSLRILDVSFNPIRYLPSNIFSKFPPLISLYIPKKTIISFPKSWRNFSSINFNLSDPFLPTNSLQSQIVYENEQFILNCSSNTPHYWTLNKHFHPSTIISFSYSTIIIHHLQINHSGIWTCHNSQSNRSLSLTVLKNSSNYFCQSIQMNTSKGYFYWPRTLINQKIEIKCPFGSAAWLRNSNQYARAWYTCSSTGQWKNFDISQCAFQTDISRVFDYLSLNESNLLLGLVQYLSKIDRNEMILDDIILLIDLIDEQHEKYQNQDRIMLIYHLTDFILQIKHHFTFLQQYQLAITRLRLIIERLLDFTNQSWLYIGKELTTMTVQSPLSSTLCFVPNRSLLTITCDMDNPLSKSQLVTIEFPSHPDRANQYSLFRIIVYRQSILFTSDELRNNHPVVYVRSVSRNNFSTIKLTFSDQSNEVSIGIWRTNQTSWQMKPSICKVNAQNNNLISTDCILHNNNSLSITYFNNPNFHKNIFLNKKYSQLIISLSSIIASICFFSSSIFYICFHKIYQMPRRFFHCLINYWFNLGILLPLFAFGIHLNQYPFVCQFIAISLHYLCLTTMLWLTLLTYSIWRKLYVISIDEDHYKKSSTIITDDQTDGLAIKELKFKAVIHFYFLAYGIALIICGINVIVSREQYLITQICFLYHFDSMLTLILPILIFIFLLLAFLLLARNSIQNLSHQSDIKSHEILPILISSNHNTEQILSKSTSDHVCSTDIDHQYESINQLLSILSQLILLIFLFLSSLAIYLQPLYSVKLRFEHIIYSHIYGFFVLFLAFYILSFYVLSRSRLILRYYSNRKKHGHKSIQSSLSIHSMSNKVYDIPSFTEQTSILPTLHVHDSSTKQSRETSQNSVVNDEPICATKRLTNTTSEYYICHHHILKTSSAQNIPKDTLVLSYSDAISQETMPTLQSPRDSFFERSSKRSINIPIESDVTHTTSPLSLTSSQSFHHPRISLSQAIIRPLPITRLSSENKNKPLSTSADHMQSTSKNTYCAMSSPSSEEYDVIKKNDDLIQQESSNDKSLYDQVQVLYIDEDDERSVSLKSTISDSKTSSCTISTKKNHSQTLSTSSSSSSSNFSQDFCTNQIKLHESSV